MKLNLRKKILAAVAVASACWSIPASADAYSEAQALYGSWAYIVTQYCQQNYPDDFAGCVIDAANYALSTAAANSNNLNPLNYDQLVQYNFYYMVYYGNSGGYGGGGG